MTSLTNKFHPNNFKCSAKMHAILGCICGESWAKPELYGLSVTSDGFVSSMDIFLGSAKDFYNNINGCLDAVEATEEERNWFWHNYDLKVSDWNSTGNHNNTWN